MYLTDLEASKLGGISRAALLQHRSRAARGKAAALDEQGALKTPLGIRYQPETFLIWVTRVRGREEVQRHLAQLEEAAMDLLEGGRKHPIEDPVLELQAQELAASLADHSNHLMAAKVLTLGEMLVARLERRIGREEALKYAAGMMRRIGWLIARERKRRIVQKKPPSRRKHVRPTRGGT